MQKYIKAGMLTLVLVLPALVILLLHGFAENHFQIPYLVPLTDSSGKISMNGKDTLFYRVPSTDRGQIKIVSFFAKSDSKQLIQQYSRVEKLASDDVLLVNIDGNEGEKEATQKYRVSLLKKEKSLETIPYNEQFVLLDKKGYIRGFYDGTNPEEVDRLSAEVKILLDIYKKEQK
jgi:protein SCO1/2